MPVTSSTMGNRGIEKQLFQLPNFIAATGIEKIRQEAYIMVTVFVDIFWLEVAAVNSSLDIPQFPSFLKNIVSLPSFLSSINRTSTIVICLCLFLL
ncbi:unnamed protein product [Trifolium pratense]|uniref:Uncharacterized protein n=1 Tax=Trifolium pratense TaxID=57577 RepID=A0ACB0K9P2_TRIPR|nr:unnamed protein product [Trifolium pratense]